MTDQRNRSGSPLSPQLFLVATQFLSSLPSLSRQPVSARQLGLAVGFFPLVGLWMGGVLVAADWLLGDLFAAPLKAALLLGIWLLLSGGLHLADLLDASDGLFGGHNPERRLEIMRDEATGAFGFAGGAILLLVKFSALQSSVALPAALLLAPVLGRWAMSLAIVVYPYAREEGLGSAMKAHAGLQQALLASLLALAVSWFGAGWWGLLSMGAVGVFLLAVGAFVRRRIPGFTGDIYGALCELSEAAVLLLMAGIWHA